MRASPKPSCAGGSTNCRPPVRARAAETLVASTGRFFGRDLYQAKAVIPFPSLTPQDLDVSIRDAKLYQTFDYTLKLPAAQ